MAAKGGSNSQFFYLYRTDDLGVNSFITKPVTFEGLVAVMRILGKYWVEIVELPDRDGRCETHS